MSESQTRTRVLAEAGEELVAEVAEALQEGALVLLPTETVYGLVCRADDPAAIERLQALKGRGDKPFARLAPSLASVIESGAAVPEGAQRLAQRYWPGPLTLILDAPDGSTIGYRVPGHPFALAVTEAVGAPLVATSANLSGEEATTTFAAAMAAIGEGVDLAIDGGESQLRASSTVVRVASGPDAGPPELLREGFLERASIERALTRLVVFVCTGNTCRSPMAEALFRKRLADELEIEPAALSSHGWRVASAGVAAGYGGSAAGNAISTMRERGLDIAAHQSQPLSHDMAADAELIVGLTPGHVSGILDRWPGLAEKVIVLDPQGVPDPIGGSPAVYRECADHIDRRLEQLVDELLEPPEDDGGRGELSPELFPAVGSIPAEVDPGRYDGGRRYLINGEVKTWEGATVPVEAVVCERGEDESLTRRVLGESAQLSGGEAMRALQAAVAAWDLGRGEWPTAPLARRIDAIRAFCQAIESTREEVARLLMWEVGKPWASALKEFDRTVAYIDDTLAALTVREREASRFRDEGGVLAMVRRAPLGVVLCMGPFNYPLNETYTTVIPALAMGNPVVIKLPKLGMLCNLPLLDALAECFPPGVVNVISGDGREVVTPIIRSGKVDALAFIGSSTVAGIIEKQHPAPYRLATILGMDAKNPAIVLPSADLEQAVQECLKGSLSFNGQRCTALKLLFVHRSLAERFAARLAEEVEQLCVGMPWEPDVALTPMPEPGKAAWLTELLDDALAKGAEIQNPHGGMALETFFFPAVVYPVSPDSRLYAEEQFGPLVPIVPFDDVSEVQSYVAESKYGQQASVFGTDPAELGPLIDALANQVCRINLNQACQRGPDSYPFGGRKCSAEGVLSVTDALDAFSLPAMVATSTVDGRDLIEQLVEAKTSGFLRSED